MESNRAVDHIGETVYEVCVVSSDMDVLTTSIEEAMCIAEEEIHRLYTQLDCECLHSRSVALRHLRHLKLHPSVRQRSVEVVEFTMTRDVAEGRMRPEHAEDALFVISIDERDLLEMLTIEDDDSEEEEDGDPPADGAVGEE